MILGLKTVVWCVSNYHVIPMVPGQNTVQNLNAGGHRQQRMSLGKPLPMTPTELRMIARFLDFGLRCFIVYTRAHRKKRPANGALQNEEHQNSPVVNIAEQQEIMENFANVFTVLKPCNFRDIFSLDADVDSDTHVRAVELIYHLQHVSECVAYQPLVVHSHIHGFAYAVELVKCDYVVVELA